MFQVPTRPAGHVHVEFKAGRMDWDGRMVTPDKRKGKILLYTSEEDQLTHFQWMDRDKNEVVTDLIVINDAYLERIQKCTSGRAYILRFTSSDKKMFFWMQEPSTDKDDENIKKFNEAVGATIPEKPTAATATPAATPAAAAPAAAGAAATQEIDPQLRAVLTQFLTQGGAGAGAGLARAPLPMTTVLTSEVLQSLLTDEAACSEMIGLLPESHKNQEGLSEVLCSPQLQQSLSALTQAVHSDQLPVLLASLGLDPSVINGASGDALELLCRAMESKFKE